MKRKKVAVLGGGIGSLSAVQQLLESGQDFDITVYQMGWRLGGKGASGRNLDPKLGFRIEEHGLHMWSGLYDNAFRIMRSSYKQMARPAGSPLANIEEAFTPGSNIVLYENWKGQELTWEVTTPLNDERPGMPGAKLSLDLWDYVGMVLDLVLKAPTGIKGFWGQALQVALTCVLAPLALLSKVLFSLLKILGLLSFLGGLLLIPAGFFMRIFWWYAQSRLDETPVRRAWMLSNFGFAIVRGMIRGKVFENGLDPLDEVNFLDWIALHMFPDFLKGESSTLKSPFATFIFDAQFSYQDGDLSKPNMGAGSALITIFRMAFTWKGAILWHMQGSMGEVVFVPLYEILKAKGVKFEFFHQVKKIEFDEKSSTVKSIRGLVQAVTKNAAYDPLFNVKGLPCWPSEPFWDQLQGGEKLKQQGVLFESYECQVGTEFCLEADRDFDEVIFGFPGGCIPYVAPDLAKLSSKWRDFVDSQKYVRTQALQIWMTAPKGTLGVPGGAEALAVTYHPTPLNTMADMTFLIPKEDWRGSETSTYPQSLFYFCGPLSPLDQNLQGSLLQEAGDKSAAADSLKLLSSLIEPLMPLATVPPQNEGAPLNWNLLVDQKDPNSSGAARLNAQYTRANTSPSELFTLTNYGATKHRIKPGESGFSNFKIAGDWTDNTFNLANIEATVMSGMLCSHALCGYPKLESIVGLGFGRSSFL